MRQQIDEVEHERRDAFGRDDARQSPLDVVALGGRRHLLVANGDLDLELLELRLEELALVRVERFVLALAPPIGKARRDLAGKESAEQRVARVRRRRGQNAEVVRRLDVEQRRDDRLEHAPLIETQAVDDDEQRLLVGLEDRQQEFGNDVDRQRRPIALEILAAIAGYAVFMYSRELAAQVGIESLQRLVEPRLVRGDEIEVPLRQLAVPVDPSAPSDAANRLRLELAEALDELRARPPAGGSSAPSRRRVIAA